MLQQRYILYNSSACQSFGSLYVIERIYALYVNWTESSRSMMLHVTTQQTTRDTVPQGFPLPAVVNCQVLKCRFLAGKLSLPMIELVVEWS
jgi:hypothetical protein